MTCAQLKEEVREEVTTSMMEVKDEVNACHTEVSAITIAVDSLAGRLRRLEAVSDPKEKACTDPAAVSQTCLDAHPATATATTGVTQMPLTSCPVPLSDQTALRAPEATTPCLPAPSPCSSPVAFPGYQTNTI